MIKNHAEFKKEIEMNPPPWTLITKLYYQHHSTEPNLPENLVAPITVSLPPQWVQHASSPATLQKPQLVKLLTWIDVRITLIFEQLWIYWWKNECIMMNMKTLAATPPRNIYIYRLFLIKAPSLKKERANLLSTFQLLFVPIPVFGTWRCGQSQKTRTLLIRMSFPAGNPDRKILKGTCPPRLVGKWVSFPESIGRKCLLPGGHTYTGG